MELLDKRTASVLFTILFFAAAATFLYAARRVLVVFLLAIFFTYLLDPLVSRLQNWEAVSRGSRIVAIFEVYGILGLVICVAVFTAGGGIVSQSKKLAEALPGLFENVSSGQIVQQIGSNRGWTRNTETHVQQFLASHRDVILGWVGAALSRLGLVAQNVIWILVIPILAIFFLKDGRNFSENILREIQNGGQRRFVSGITDDLDKMLAHYTRSQLVLSGISVMFYVIVLTMLRVPYGAALGLIAGVLEFIPVLGPLVGALSILGIAFLSNYSHLAVVAALLGGWRLFQDYVTTPRILGGKLRLHPLAVIFAILVGGEVFGIIGVYLSIPIAAGLHIIWRRWHSKDGDLSAHKAV